MGHARSNVGRRVAIAFLSAASMGVVLGQSSGSAGANECQKPDELGNVNVSAGVVTVGVDQDNVGTTEHDVFACIGPSIIATGSVQLTDAPGLGLRATPAACVPLTAPCGNSADLTTGAEVVPPPTVGVPSPGVDPPADGNGRVAIDAGTGNTACLWAPTVSTCGSYSGAGGDVSPRPDPVGLANYMIGMGLGLPNYVSFCWEMAAPQLINGGIGCGLVLATQYVVIPVAMVMGWL